MDTQRFVDAQDPLWDDVRTELRAGDKRTHWMWFVFPQLAGLGTSDMNRRYAIPDLDAAREYLAHPVLGPRLLEVTELLLAHPDRTALEVLHSPDDRKLRSSMTLFGRADPDQPLFGQVLDQWYRGVEDRETVSRL
ncbi:calpastatin [Geodermatophilus sp. Leaf369]|jgi:uncharacterized protein (DUF1810 family)|uniref:DUF1810 domain-containing protein n=1 Tax=Geodermatophilus sp. Leaf369 TaxID=1736354 RepID=UPI0006FBEBDE|nr:DUF1810 domain-containing protein [Geodermatophilus sp. Leaf369]KQS60546.1 calpastatin [Geodermatophilus sp. Leaf369]QNG37368.1 DUF1810 domain-containing protein [Geodermatophilaceae bacterium NBWT11]